MFLIIALKESWVVIVVYSKLIYFVDGIFSENFRDDPHTV